MEAVRWMEQSRENRNPRSLVFGRLGFRGSRDGTRKSVLVRVKNTRATQDDENTSIKCC